MMIRLSVLFLLISYLLACSPGDDWVPTTLEEQVNHSGAIIYGRVSQVFLDAGDKDVIRLSSSIFLKGCGPSINDVDGFTSALSCIDYRCETTKLDKSCDFFGHSFTAKLSGPATWGNVQDCNNMTIQ